MAGLLSAFMAGAANFGAKQIERSLIEDAQAERDARLAEIAKEGHRYASELAEGRDVAKEGRVKAERTELGVAVTKATTGQVDDLSGTVRDKTPREKLEAKRDVYAGRGLVDQEMKSEELIQRDEEARQRTLDRSTDNDRADRQLAEQSRHNQATERNQAATNSRLTALANEQLAGLKLDNKQKQQLADLDDKYNKSTDPKEREKLAQDRLLLTGKWSETFEVKTGVNPQTGEPTVLGYIDKRRGTFTTPDGTVTDMRTGKKAGVGAAQAPANRPPLSSFGGTSKPTGTRGADGAAPTMFTGPSGINPDAPVPKAIRKFKSAIEEENAETPEGHVPGVVDYLKRALK